MVSEQPILKKDLAIYSPAFNVFLNILESFLVLFLILFSLDPKYSGSYPDPLIQFTFPGGLAAASVYAWVLNKISHDKEEYSNYLDHMIQLFKTDLFAFLVRSILYIAIPILTVAGSLYLNKSVHYQTDLYSYLSLASIAVSTGSFINFIHNKNTTKFHVVIYLVLCVVVIFSQYFLSFPIADQGIFKNFPLLFSWAIPFVGFLKKPKAQENLA